MKELKKVRKNLFALLVALMVCLNSMDITAFAEDVQAAGETQKTEETTEILEKAEESHTHNLVNCGTCAGTGEVENVVDCPDCDGPVEAVVCERCGGEGRVIERYFSWDNPPCPNNGYACGGCQDCLFGYAWVYEEVECDACDGLGKVVDSAAGICPTCGGVGITKAMVKCSNNCENGKVSCTGTFGGEVFAGVDSDGNGQYAHICDICGASYTVTKVLVLDEMLASEAVAFQLSTTPRVKAGEYATVTLKVTNNTAMEIIGADIELAFGDMQNVPQFAGISVASGASESYTVKVEIPADAEPRTTYDAAATVNAVTFEGGIKANATNPTSSPSTVTVTKYSEKNVRLYGAFMGRWYEYMPGTADSTGSIGTLSSLENVAFRYENFGHSFDGKDFWNEYVVNYHSKKTWQCAGFIPVSSRGDFYGNDLLEYVWTDNTAQNKFHVGSLADAKDYVTSNNGILYGEMATEAQLTAWDNMNNFKLIAVWFIADAPVQRLDRTEIVPIKAVTPVVFEDISEDVTISTEIVPSANIGWYDAYITVTIGEDAPVDTEVIVNLAKAGEKLVQQPGDHFVCHIKINDESGRNYRFVDNSAAIGTFEHGEYTGKTVGVGFDGYPIPFGAVEGPFSVIPRRTLNGALTELGATEYTGISDDAIGGLLKVVGYGTPEMTNEEVTQNYLGHYYLDYVSAKVGKQIDSFQDVDDNMARSFFSATSYAFVGVDETCPVVAEAYYYFYYGKVWTFNSIPLYDQMSDMSILNRDVKAALDAGEEYVLDVVIDGEVTGNAGQDTLLIFNFGLKFDLKSTVGNLTITKAVGAGPESAVTEQEYSFTVTGPEGFETQVVTIKGADSVTLENLPLGVYTVTENTEDAEITGYDLTVKDEGTATVTLVAGETVEAIITNTYTKQLGSLTITKVVEGGPESAATKEYSFTVTGPDDYSETVTITGAGSVTLEGLTPGEYTVTENDASIDGWIWNKSGEGVVVVAANEEANITITNSYDSITPTPPVTVTPGPTPEVTPEPTPEVTPEPTPEVTPEPTPEVTPGPTPEVTPEPTPEVTPEPTPEVEIPEEETPLGNPDVTPTPEPTPEIEIPEEEPPLGTPDATPKTGDFSRTSLWAVLCLLSMCGMGVFFFPRRKRQ